MIFYLDPEELEKFSELERIEKETSAEMATLIERALSRQPLTEWKDAISSEKEALINQLSADLREAYPKMEPDEIYRYSELSHQCGAAAVAISELMRLAADKAELEEGDHSSSA